MFYCAVVKTLIFWNIVNWYQGIPVVRPLIRSIPSDDIVQIHPSCGLIIFHLPIDERELQHAYFTVWIQCRTSHVLWCKRERVTILIFNTSICHFHYNNFRMYVRKSFSTCYKSNPRSFLYMISQGQYLSGIWCKKRRWFCTYF